MLNFPVANTSWVQELPATILLLSLCTALGCGSQAVTENDALDESLVNELLGSLDDGAGNASRTSDSGSIRLNSIQTAATGLGQQTPATPVTAKAVGERLELRLQRGDRFPLIKTVEQMLVQKSDQYPAVARTKLELTMAIQVEQVRDDAVLLSVRYSRVFYSHDLNGQRLEFDSQAPAQQPPYDVQPYAGMVNNGFAFWLGKNNRILELVGYQEFLQRCVEQVPADRRQSLLSEISHKFGDDGVANFIDDSIGLLPYDDKVDADSATRVLPGDVWTREMRLMQPAPVYLTSTYRLVSLNDRMAEIDITGRIASGESIGQGRNGNLKITGGHSIGRCLVDRTTGLPVETTLTRYISMIVRLPNGLEVPQDKQIVTMIQAFPEARGRVVQQPARTDFVQPAAAWATPSAGAPSTHIATPIPTRTEPVTPARAVYPD